MRYAFMTALYLALAILTGGASVAAAEPDESVESLEQQRIAAAQEAYEQNKAMVAAGISTKSEEDLYVWSRRWMEAELATTDANSPQRIATIEKHLKRMQVLEERGKSLHRTGYDGPTICLPALGYYVMEAELLLREEKERQE